MHWNLLCDVTSAADGVLSTETQSVPPETHILQRWKAARVEEFLPDGSAAIGAVDLNVGHSNGLLLSHCALCFIPIHHLFCCCSLLVVRRTEHWWWPPLQKQKTKKQNKNKNQEKVAFWHKQQASLPPTPQHRFRPPITPPTHTHTEWEQYPESASTRDVMTLTSLAAFSAISFSSCLCFSFSFSFSCLSPGTQHQHILLGFIFSLIPSPPQNYIGYDVKR